MYTGPDKMLAVMSIGFLLEHKDDAVVWRGPKKNGTVEKAVLLCNKLVMYVLSAMIKQFLSDVVWEELDYLIIDTPPGKFLHQYCACVHHGDVCVLLVRTITWQQIFGDKSFHGSTNLMHLYRTYKFKIPLNHLDYLLNTASNPQKFLILEP